MSILQQKQISECSIRELLLFHLILLHLSFVWTFDTSDVRAPVCLVCPVAPPLHRQKLEIQSVGQNAMSTLMLQGMSRRAAGGSGVAALQGGDQGNNPGTSTEPKKEMRTDEKWIPAMPTASWKSWTSRSREWLDVRVGWNSIQVGYVWFMMFMGQNWKRPSTLHLRFSNLGSMNRPWEARDFFIFCSRSQRGNYRVKWFWASSFD